MKKVLVFILSFIVFFCVCFVGVKASSDGNVYEDDSTGWEISFIEEDQVSIKFDSTTHQVYTITKETDNIFKVVINDNIYYYELDSVNCKAKQVDAGYVAKMQLDNEVKGLGGEIKEFWDWIVLILASCGISLSSIAAVIKWIKNKLNKGNVEIKTITAALEHTRCELQEAKEQVTKLTNTVQLLLTELKKNYNVEKEKQNEISKLINEVLDE